MKTIYSDKIGRNIHSPFVYRLVAHTLCLPYPFYAFEKIEKSGLSKNETGQLKTIFRLINFFWFDEVYYIGQNPTNYATTCKLARPGIKFTMAGRYDLPIGSVFKPEYRHIVIFDSVVDELNEYPVVPEIWFIPDLKENDSQKFFLGLKFVENARITIEINKVGIAIFNRIFEKQDYVIKP